MKLSLAIELKFDNTSIETHINISELHDYLTIQSCRFETVQKSYRLVNKGPYPDTFLRQKESVYGVQLPITSQNVDWISILMARKSKTWGHS